MPKKAAKKVSPENKSSDNIDSILSSIDDLLTISGVSPVVSTKKSRGEIDPQKLKERGFGDAQINEIVKGSSEGLDVEAYADTGYDWMQMHEIRKGLLKKLDTTIYKNQLFSASQMREIRLGLEDGLNVAAYAKLMLSATDMNRIRKILLEEAYKNSPHGFAKTIEDDDTGIVLRISDDCMDAYMSIPDTAGQSFSHGELLQVLKSHEITYGYLDSNIDKLSNKGVRNQELCVAKGKPAIEGKPGRYELFFQNAIDNSHIVMPDEEVDYSNVDTIESVNPGKILARYHYSQKDVDGKTVTGILIKGIPGDELPKLTGKGIKKDPVNDVYFAAEKGYVFYNATAYSLNVEKIYEINEDVSYLKSFEYDGTIYVHGGVRNKSTIRASGNIIIDGFVEDAYVYAGQNVVLKSGCNGNERGIIESGGSIHGKFFENITLKAKGLVEGNYFLNCNIDTDDRVVARGIKARITGGNTNAVVGVEAVILGNYMGTRAQCSVGDTTRILKQTAALIKERSEALDKVEKLTRSRLKLLDLLGESAAKGNSLYNQACAALESENIIVADLSHEIDRLALIEQRAKRAYIRIQGEIQEDVILKLGGKPCKIKNPGKRGVNLSRDKINK